MIGLTTLFLALPIWLGSGPAGPDAPIVVQESAHFEWDADISVLFVRWSAGGAEAVISQLRGELSDATSDIITPDSEEGGPFDEEKEGTQCVRVLEIPANLRKYLAVGRTLPVTTSAGTQAARVTGPLRFCRTSDGHAVKHDYRVRINAK